MGGQMGPFVLTLAVGLGVGTLFYRLRIPGGMMVGSIVGAAALNIFFGVAAVPLAGKVFAQIAAGAFIGSTIQRSDLKRLRTIGKPASLLLGNYLLAMLAMGFIIHAISPVDLPTALFAAVPGGISDIPIIAVDMGANGPQVAALQFVRLAVGAGVFPSVIGWVCRNEVPEQGREESASGQGESGPVGRGVFPATLGLAILCGTAGYLLGVSAGALVFSLAGVIALKLLWGKTHLPVWLKRLAQVLSGAYIGSSVGMDDLLELRFLVIPALLLVLGYSALCFLDGWLLSRFCGMGRKEAMLAATPAGASDMALISLDMGVQSTDLVVLHVLRLVVVSSLFPQVIGLLLRWVG